MCVIQREATIHRSKIRDGPFRNNLYPRDYFQSNPYRSDKPLPPPHKPLLPGQKVSPVPFKPPSRGKKVIISPAGVKSISDHSLTTTCAASVCSCDAILGQIGGMKVGTFGPYPSHSVDPYVIRHSKPTNQEPVFHPVPGPKSAPVRSIIALNVNRLMRSVSDLLFLRRHKSSSAG